MIIMTRFLFQPLQNQSSVIVLLADGEHSYSFQKYWQSVSNQPYLELYKLQSHPWSYLSGHQRDFMRNLLLYLFILSLVHNMTILSQILSVQTNYSMAGFQMCFFRGWCLSTEGDCNIYFNPQQKQTRVTRPILYQDGASNSAVAYACNHSRLSYMGKKHPVLNPPAICN